MTARRFFLIGGTAFVALVALAGAAFWYVFLRNDAPPAVSLTSALAALESTTPAATGTTPAGATTAPATTTGAAATSTATATATTPAAADGEAGTATLDGTWTVDATLDSFVGYRIGEELARIGTTTAVGRTSAVTGEIVVEGEEVQSARVVADMTALQSDSSMRDSRLRNDGIETDRYPTATFALTQTIALPATLLEGERFATTLVGELTLHGVTRAVEVPAEAQLAGGRLVVVGSVEIELADYDISKPSGASVLSIEDSGVLELQLYLARS